MRIVVFGGAGFIGSAVSRHLLAHRGAHVLVVDKLTHISRLSSLANVAQSPRYSIRKADLRDRERIAGLIQAFAPDAIVHAAIEKSTDRMIGGPADDEEANLVGTSNLVDAARSYYAGLSTFSRERFRFLSVSSQESTSAVVSAIADRIVAAAHETYGLPAIVSKADATYGPRQLPGEPVAAQIIASLDGCVEFSASQLPARLLHIDDHVEALASMLDKGVPGETYSVTGAPVAGSAELKERIARLVERHLSKEGSARARLEAVAAAVPAPERCQSSSRQPVADKLYEATGWRPEHTLASGLTQTVRWFVDNQAWWRPLQAAEGAGNAYGILRSA